MSNNEPRPFSEASPNNSLDDQTAIAPDELSPPEDTDAPPLSPRDNDEIESACAYDWDQALAAADEWHMAEARYLNREIGSPRVEAFIIGERLRSDLVIYARINLLVAAFAENEPALRELMVELAQKGLATEKDVRQGLGSAKLMSWCDIGHHAGVLSQLNLPLGAGLSVLHKAAQLCEMLPGDSEAKTLALLALQRELGGVLTKSGMEKEFSALKDAASRANQKGIESPNGKHSDGQPEKEPVEVDLVFFTPGADRSVIADFAEHRPKSWLNIGPLRRDAIAVVVTTPRDYAAWAQQLGRRGLKHIAHFLPTKVTAGPHLVDSQIVVIATETPLSAMRIHLEENNWLQDVQDGDWRTLVDRLIPDAVHKRHMFATDHADGWDCVIGEENWKAK